jgi:fatty acid desaturase (delta-4 desaturase)
MPTRSLFQKPWVNDFSDFTDLIWWQQMVVDGAALDSPATPTMLRRIQTRLCRTMLLFNDYPLHPARMWYHRFQVFFYVPVLAGYWVSSVFNPEVLDLKQRGAMGWY